MKSKLVPLLLAVATAGCSGSGSRVAVGSADPEMVVGQVHLTGSGPAVMVTLVTDGGRSLNLRGGGELRGEIRSLSGAVVAVRGASSGDGRDFEVESYEIRSIDGQTPSVGVLVMTDEQIWLEGATRIRLVEAPGRLREQIGAKVWILGRSVDGGLHPQTYGIIRTP